MVILPGETTALWSGMFLWYEPLLLLKFCSLDYFLIHDNA